MNDCLLNSAGGGSCLQLSLNICIFWHDSGEKFLVITWLYVVITWKYLVITISFSHYNVILILFFFLAWLQYTAVPNSSLQMCKNSVRISASYWLKLRLFPRPNKWPLSMQSTHLTKNTQGAVGLSLRRIRGPGSKQPSDHKCPCWQQSTWAFCQQQNDRLERRQGRN